MFPDLTRDDVFRLETRRLWLRWPRAADAAAIRRIVADAPVAEIAAAFPHLDPAAGPESFVLAARAGNAGGRGIELAVALKPTQAVVGMVSARARGAGVEIGVVLAAQEWDEGYASEAVEALSDVVFALTYAPEISARGVVGDGARARVLEKLGFADAGEEVDDGVSRGGPRRWRRYRLTRAARGGARARRVPAMTQQSASQQSMTPQKMTPQTLGAPPTPEAPRVWA